MSAATKAVTRAVKSTMANGMITAAAGWPRAAAMALVTRATPPITTTPDLTAR